MSNMTPETLKTVLENAKGQHTAPDDVIELDNYNLRHLPKLNANDYMYTRVFRFHNNPLDDATIYELLLFFEDLNKVTKRDVVSMFLDVPLKYFSDYGYQYTQEEQLKGRKHLVLHTIRKEDGTRRIVIIPENLFTIQELKNSILNEHKKFIMRFFPQLLPSHRGTVLSYDIGPTIGNQGPRNGGSGKKTKKRRLWKNIKPHSEKSRRSMKTKYGPKCFLEPKTMKYPICSKYTGKQECMGLYAADYYLNINIGKIKNKKSKTLRNKYASKLKKYETLKKKSDTLKRKICKKKNI